MRNRLGFVVCTLVALAAALLVLSDARASARGGFLKEYVTKVAAETGNSEEFVREKAIEALRIDSRFTKGELERIGRGESLFYAKELIIRRFLQESRTFALKLGMGGVWNDTIRKDAGKAFDAMKASDGSARVVEMAKDDAARVLIEKTNLSWGEDNIMNDNGVLLSAREIEGEHEEIKFPAAAKFDSEMFRYSEKAVLEQLTVVGREGFDLDPQSLPKSLGDATDGKSILSTFKAMVAKVGINSANGAIVVSSVVVKDAQGEPRHFISMLILNRKTNRLLSIFVRSV
ncbi:MAG: hypothetical protein HY074_02655 [Deltaproteobacteria bacterium]|nr:hypothetical protein [Deltaproteobacteria bacterium]